MWISMWICQAGLYCVDLDGKSMARILLFDHFGVKTVATRKDSSCAGDQTNDTYFSSRNRTTPHCSSWVWLGQQN
jgi:hypothetical protein